MKALTVRQPWAGLIADGYKTVENRVGGTSYRGPLAIHAARAYSEDGSHDVRVRALLGHRPLERDYDAGQMGAVIAVANLVDVHVASGSCCGPWGDYGPRTRHLVLKDVRRVDPTLPMLGRLGLWPVPDRAIPHLTGGPS